MEGINGPAGYSSHSPMYVDDLIHNVCFSFYCFSPSISFFACVCGIAVPVLPHELWICYLVDKVVLSLIATACLDLRVGTQILPI